MIRIKHKIEMIFMDNQIIIIIICMDKKIKCIFKIKWWLAVREQSQISII